MIWERGEIAKKDREKCLFQCPICYQPCVTHDDLKRHLKVGHTKREVKKIYVELKLQAKADAMEQGKGKGLADVKGKAQLTPPFPPPKGRRWPCVSSTNGNGSGAGIVVVLVG